MSGKTDAALNSLVARVRRDPGLHAVIIVAGPDNPELERFLREAGGKDGRTGDYLFDGGGSVSLTWHRTDTGRYYTFFDEMTEMRKGEWVDGQWTER